MYGKCAAIINMALLLFCRYSCKVHPIEYAPGFIIFF